MKWNEISKQKISNKRKIENRITLREYFKNE